MLRRRCIDMVSVLCYDRVLASVLTWILHRSTVSGYGATEKLAVYDRIPGWRSLVSTVERSSSGWSAVSEGSAMYVYKR